MKEISELHGLLQGLVSICTGMAAPRIILADQGRAPPKGAGLYATYNPVPIRAYGQPSQRLEYTDAQEEYDESLGENWQDLEEITASSMEMMLSVNFFNEGASQAAMMLHNANFRSHVSDYLFLNKLGFRYVSNPRNLSTHFQSGIQPRWQADIHLFVEHEVSGKVLRAAGFSIEHFLER
ncbi:phage neck terminator protein [Enterobacter cloacae]|uniref:phage neck terminator protein n=1 Tax=Enterobacter cloacae TaxID=550 RepID=UPI0033495C0A